MDKDEKGDPILFEDLLPPKDAPYEIPELSDGTRERFGKDSWNEVEGGVPIFATENFTVPARSQLTFPVRWGAKRPKNRDMVIVPSEANLFSNQLTAAHCLVHSATPNPVFTVLNTRNQAVVIPTVLPLGHAFTLTEDQKPITDKTMYFP
jgi:hypothetical protein